MNEFFYTSNNSNGVNAASFHHSNSTSIGVRVDSGGHSISMEYDIIGGNGMNKKEFIEALEKEYEKGPVSEYVKGKNRGINVAHVMAKHLDEPELPVIPQFVADFIDEAKKNGWTILYVFYQVAQSELDNLDADDWIGINSEIFAHAWLDGYTIEQEKRYRLKSTNKHFDTKYFTIDGINSQCLESKSTAYLKNYKNIFTESELAEIDETGFERVEVTE